MTTFFGLAAHPLLVHFIVALTPMTAVLAILCAVWPAARERLVWLVLALSVMTASIAVFVTIAAVATTVQVIRIGHSGAESAWGDALSSSADESASGG